MPLPRYEREGARSAGPGFTRAILMGFGVAALVGLIAGIIWVIAGLVDARVLP